MGRISELLRSLIGGASYIPLRTISGPRRWSSSHSADSIVRGARTVGMGRNSHDSSLQAPCLRKRDLHAVLARSEDGMQATRHGSRALWRGRISGSRAGSVALRRGLRVRGATGTERRAGVSRLGIAAHGWACDVTTVSEFRMTVGQVRWQVYHTRVTFTMVHTAVRNVALSRGVDAELVCRARNFL